MDKERNEAIKLIRKMYLAGAISYLEHYISIAAIQLCDTTEEIEEIEEVLS